jgi:hypothetical protein
MFKAILTQAGEGCDYTIGCGIQVINIDADNMEHAKEELFNIIQEEYIDEQSLSNAVIFEVSETHECDLTDWYQTIKEQDDLQQKNLKNAEEYAEFERLKRKFE